MEPDCTSFTGVLDEISVQTFPLNHGSNEHGLYSSSAYAIRHDLSNTQFLFFGDVEPDSLPSDPSLNRVPHNLAVWRSVAPKVPETLRAIFIECSYPSGRPDSTLYGHLTPEYLVDELVVLATEVRKIKPIGHSDTNGRHTRKRQKRIPTSLDLKGALTGLTVYVMHCKDDPETGISMREVIVSQVKALVEMKALGCTVIGVEQGMRIRKCHPCHPNDASLSPYFTLGI